MNFNDPNAVNHFYRKMAEMEANSLNTVKMAQRLGVSRPTIRKHRQTELYRQILLDEQDRVAQLRKDNWIETLDQFHQHLRERLAKILKIVDNTLNSADERLAFDAAKWLTRHIEALPRDKTNPLSDGVISRFEKALSEVSLTKVEARLTASKPTWNNLLEDANATRTVDAAPDHPEASR